MTQTTHIYTNKYINEKIQCADNQNLIYT